MHYFYKLDNVIQNYSWGSRHHIQNILGKKSTEPMAEVWMGAHPKAPSLVQVKEKKIPLDSLIESNPSFFLGEKVSKHYPALPYLFKLLAAEEPLSIQAHPSLEQAKEGWEKENSNGIPIDSAQRNYKDANHKPELLAALSPFRAMCGFRNITEIKKLFSLFAAPLSTEIVAALYDENPLQLFFNKLLSMDEDAKKRLTSYCLKECTRRAEEHPEYEREFLMIQYFAQLYPEDPALLSPLYLNVIDMLPGEAIFLPAGILHAYVEGFGVELMANSDNVLRGGLTQKHIDIPELNRVLLFDSYKPAVQQHVLDSEHLLYTYQSPVQEFQLTKLCCDGSSLKIPAKQPGILLISKGTARLSSNLEGTITLGQGESVFIAGELDNFTIEGVCTAFIAKTGL